MLPKIGLTMLCAIGLFSGNAFAITEHTFNQVAAYEITLPPNEPQIFTNTFFWSLEAKCTIESENGNNPFAFTILRKSGSLNGIPLALGDAMDVTVHPGDIIYITAASGARVELINRGEKTFKANCYNGK